MALPRSRRAASLGARTIAHVSAWKLWAAAVAIVVFLSNLLLGVVMLATAVQATQIAQVSDIGAQDIPTVALSAYQEAAAQGCDGLDWWVLAGIGKVESDHGRTNGSTLLPSGETSPPIFGPELNGSGAGGNLTSLPIGQWRGSWGLTGDYQRAIGPMQFLPGTFARYAPDTTATPHNIGDAARAAASLLCDGSIADIGMALRRYNNSQAYVDEVLHWGALYQLGGGLPSADAEALLDNPNIKLTAGARQDLEAGIVDPRLTQLLVHLASTYRLEILSFRTGHPRCKVLPNKVNSGPNCSISNHWEGRAVDITSASRAGEALMPVGPRNDDARAITEAVALMSADSPLRPDEVGSPWAAYEDYHGHFSNSLHKDHLHLGYERMPSAHPVRAVTPFQR